MMRWFSLICAMLFCTTGFAAENSSAQDIAKSMKRKTLVFAAPAWEGYTNEDGTGLYWEIIKEVYEPLGFTVRLKNMPFNRSMKLMTNYRTVDGVPGEGIDSDYNGLTFADLPLEPEYLAIAYNKGKVAGFEEKPNLTGKVVGWRKGYNLLDDSYGKFKVKEFFDLEKGIALLESGSIDVLVDELSEIDAVAEHEGVDLSKFETAEFVTGDYYFMVFGQTVASQPLADIYDLRIKEIALAGMLAPLYEEWEVDIPKPVQEIIDGK